MLLEKEQTLSFYIKNVNTKQWLVQIPNYQTHYTVNENSNIEWDSIDITSEPYDNDEQIYNITRNMDDSYTLVNSETKLVMGNKWDTMTSSLKNVEYPNLSDLTMDDLDNDVYRNNKLYIDLVENKGEDLIYDIYIKKNDKKQYLMAYQNKKSSTEGKNYYYILFINDENRAKYDITLSRWIIQNADPCYNKEKSNNIGYNCYKKIWNITGCDVKLKPSDYNENIMRDSYENIVTNTKNLYESNDIKCVKQSIEDISDENIKKDSKPLNEVENTIENEIEEEIYTKFIKKKK